MLQLYSVQPYTRLNRISVKYLFFYSPHLSELRKSHHAVFTTLKEEQSVNLQ